MYGLKFVNNVWKNKIKVDKFEEVMGTFLPKNEEQVFNITAEQAPSGFLARGRYIGKIMVSLIYYLTSLLTPMVLYICNMITSAKLKKIGMHMIDRLIA